MNKVILVVILAGLFAGLGAFGLAAPYSRATSPQSATFYFQGFTFGQCPPGGTLSATPPSIETIVEVGGPCPTATMTGQYSGPTFYVTAVAYSIGGPCDEPPSPSSQVVENFSMFVSGPFLSSFNTALPVCGNSPSSFIITPTIPSGAQLTNGENLQVIIGFGELNAPPHECIVCEASFGGTLTISGYTETHAPEFPFGLAILVAVALPLLFVLRRISAKLIRQQV